MYSLQISSLNGSTKFLRGGELASALHSITDGSADTFISTIPSDTQEHFLQLEFPRAADMESLVVIGCPSNDPGKLKIIFNLIMKHDLIRVCVQVTWHVISSLRDHPKIHNGYLKFWSWVTVVTMGSSYLCELLLLLLLLLYSTPQT